LEPLENKFGTVRRQDLDELYHFDGSFYISLTSAFLKKKSFYHSKTLGFKMPKWKSFEIDDIVDFFVVEGILKNLKNIQ
ncbi:MAG: acylneuraminate cytidylyltransferase family protein, partial [Saprospirales bacterium]